MADLDNQLGELTAEYDSAMVIDALLKRAREGGDVFLARGVKGLEYNRAADTRAVLSVMRYWFLIKEC